MKKFSVLFLVLGLNSEANAIVMFLARTEDPKKAEVLWNANEQANELFYKDRKKYFDLKYAAKKTKVAPIVDEKVVAADESLMTDALPSARTPPVGDALESGH